MIGFRLLLIAVALAAVAYVWNTSSSVPVVTSIEPVYDYIIGLKDFPFCFSFPWLEMLFATPSK